MDALPSPASRRGYTMLELAVLLALLALLAALVVPPLARQRDRLAVAAAASDVAGALALARELAIAEQRPAAVRLSASAVVVHVERDSVARLDVGATHHVTLTATRDSLAYAIGGLAVGLANVSIIVRRGQAAETVFVSRLGRVRY